MHSNPTLKLDGSKIPVVDKFLGVIFYEKLSFTSYIRYLKDEYNKKLKLLRVITHKKTWGTDYHIF